MNIPEPLKDQLRKGKVIPFVGAGVSMAVTSQNTGEALFPSWKALLQEAAVRFDQIQKPAEANLVRSLLAVDPPEYLEAAKRAQRGLGAEWFRFLKAQIDHPYDDVNQG